MRRLLPERIMCSSMLLTTAAAAAEAEKRASCDVSFRVSNEHAPCPLLASAIVPT